MRIKQSLNKNLPFFCIVMVSMEVVSIVLYISSPRASGTELQRIVHILVPGLPKLYVSSDGKTANDTHADQKRKDLARLDVEAVAVDMLLWLIQTLGK